MKTGQTIWYNGYHVIEEIRGCQVKLEGIEDWQILDEMSLTFHDMIIALGFEKRMVEAIENWYDGTGKYKGHVITFNDDTYMVYEGMGYAEDVDYDLHQALTQLMVELEAE